MICFAQTTSDILHLTSDNLTPIDDSPNHRHRGWTSDTYDTCFLKSNDYWFAQTISDIWHITPDIWWSDTNWRFAQANHRQRLDTPALWNKMIITIIISSIIPTQVDFTPRYLREDDTGSWLSDGSAAATVEVHSDPGTKLMMLMQRANVIDNSKQWFKIQDNSRQWYSILDIEVTPLPL